MRSTYTFLALAVILAGCEPDDGTLLRSAIVSGLVLAGAAGAVALLVATFRSARNDAESEVAVYGLPDGYDVGATGVSLSSAAARLLLLLLLGAGVVTAAKLSWGTPSPSSPEDEQIRAIMDRLTPEIKSAIDTNMQAESESLATSVEEAAERGARRGASYVSSDVVEEIADRISLQLIDRMEHRDALLERIADALAVIADRRTNDDRSANDFEVHVVLFDWSKDSVSRSEQDRLRDELRTIRAGKRQISRVIILGYADTSGKSKPNVTLSERRAEEIAKFIRNDFEQAGEPSPPVTLAPLGESVPRGAADDGLADAYNRIAEVIFVFQRPSLSATAK